jgi:DNA-binding CsgD family transcriptional regulator
MLPARRRWDSLPKQAASGDTGQAKPPFPTHLTDAIWIVSRLDASSLAPFIPAGLKPTAEMIGVLGIFDAPQHSALGPFARAFGGVTVQGHQAPDSKDAVYVIADLVSDKAARTWRANYVDTCLVGEPRVWWEGDALHGAVASDGLEWLHVVLRAVGPAQDGITGQDAYLGRVNADIARHIASYHGTLLPCEVVSLHIADGAPAAFAALRPKELILGVSARDLHVTWSEAQAVSLVDTRSVSDGDAGSGLPGLLRSIGLTPAEARVALLYGNGRTAREAAQELGISEHTAKSTLKNIYGKLGVRKQSELARLIARLT